MQANRILRELFKNFKTIHAEAVASGEVDFEIATNALNHNKDQLGLTHLNSSGDKGYPLAQIALAEINANGAHGLPVNLLLSYQWIERAATGAVANAKYILALLIFNAKQMHYQANLTITEKQKIDIAGGKPQSGSAENKLVNVLLKSQEVLDHIKQKFDNPEGIPHAKKLLQECKGQFKPSVDLLERITASQANEKKRAHRKKAAMPINEAKEEPTQPVLTELNNACWTVLKEGLTGGKGELFFKALQESGTYSNLFPPVLVSTQEEIEANDLWLQARLSLIDASYAEGNRSYESKAAVLLVVKELPGEYTQEDLEKVHAAYRIPFPCDDKFKEHVKYIHQKKFEFLYYIGDAPVDIIETIYRIVYDEKAAPEKTIAAKLKEKVGTLQQIERDRDFWSLIRRGFSNGSGALFLKKLQDYGAYSILFPSILQQQNDTWLQARLELLDTRHEEGMFFYKEIAAVMLIAKELPENWKLTDLKKVRVDYQIPYPCDDRFESHVRYVAGRKKMFLAEEAAKNLTENDSAATVVPQRKPC